MSGVADPQKGFFEELVTVRKMMALGLVLLLVGVGLIAYALPCISAFGLPPYAYEGAKAVYRVEAAGVNETYTRVVEVVEANSTHITVRDQLLHPNGTVVGEETTSLRLSPDMFLPGLPLSEQLYPLGLKTVETPVGSVAVMQYIDLALGVYYAIDPETRVAVVITQAGPFGVINQTLTSLELPKPCRLG